MKRSDINFLVRTAAACFQAHGWSLPPEPRWDVTDFGLGVCRRYGLVLVNLAEEPEYCEKLMYARQGMATPAHCHRRKKEDIISRWGTLAVQIWAGDPRQLHAGSLWIGLDGRGCEVHSGDVIELAAGSRVTLVPGVYHEFWPVTGECIIGEVSTANDDRQDNFFADPDVGRYPHVEEDEPAELPLISDLQP